MLIASDLHFGANRLEDIDAFMAAAVDPGENPDRIVILAGDFTMAYSEAEYAAATVMVSDLLTAGCIVVATPGNHDFGRWTGERLYVRDDARERFRTLLGPVHEQKAVLAFKDCDSVTRVGDDVFVSLRSTHRGTKLRLGLAGHGRIKGDQLDWANAVLGSMDLDGCRLHLVTHRSLWAEADDRHGQMHKVERLERELLLRFRFASFIHGHNHRFTAAVTTTPAVGHKTVRVSAPTLSLRNRKESRGWVKWSGRPEDTPTLVERIPVAESVQDELAASCDLCGGTRGTTGRCTSCQQWILEQQVAAISAQDAESVIANMVGWIAKHGGAGPANFFKQVVLLYEMGRDAISGKYSVPWITLATIAATLAYVFSPIDLIPDSIPIAGLIDDAVNVKLALRAIRSELEKYAAFRGLDLDQYGLAGGTTPELPASSDDEV